ncbi:MAG TPA: HNH endonuclease [Anaeromyxobacteraceae bacterium]|nr:HNH endonuclease [Anaeromyxobacteraceae bacterium]
MKAVAPSCLESDALARRLRDLVGDERNVQVDFLLHLEEFDRRRAWAEAGYDSLWTYCQRALHLREGPAGRRIGAMRVLRRFPGLEPALRDGRLCLSTVTVLGPLLTPANVDGLVERAAYLTKAEVEHLAASLQPRAAPKHGLRKLPVRSAAATATALMLAPPRRCERTAVPPTEPGRTDRPPAEEPRPVGSGGQGDPLSQVVELDVPEVAPFAVEQAAVRSEHRWELRPVSADRWSLRVTLDASLKADLDALTTLTSHSTAGDLAAVLREAVRCALEKHGKRKGAVAVTARPASPGNPDETSEQDFGRDHMAKFGATSLILG